jgi:hypothetical protein
MQPYCLWNWVVKTVWDGCIWDGDPRGCSHRSSRKEWERPWVKTAKTRFSRQEAYAFVEQHDKRGKCPWTAYFCQNCCYWHIGRPPQQDAEYLRKEQLALDILELGTRPAKALRNENSPIGYFYIRDLRPHWEQKMRSFEKRRAARGA